MNRERKTAESFFEYRANLKKEEAHLRSRLRGRYVHISCEAKMVPVYDDWGKIMDYKPMVQRPGNTFRKET